MPFREPRYELEKVMIDIAARTYIKAGDTLAPDEAFIRTMDHLHFGHQALVLSFGGLKKFSMMWQAVYEQAESSPENGGQDTLDRAA